MLTENELKELLGDIENDCIERTVSTSNIKKFSEVICAYANDLSGRKHPGYLFIGVDDNGSLVGLKVTDELLRNLGSLRSEGNVLPQPALMVYKISLPEGDVAVVEVSPSSLTPVRYKGRVYVRIGARKGVANEEEERILTERRISNIQNFDVCPCLEAIRELLMNSVMHRDYQCNAPIKFYEYSDRLEIDNAGNLYGKARPENFPHENDYRNPTITEVMKVLGYVNRYSRGVDMVQKYLTKMEIQGQNLSSMISQLLKL